MKLSSLPLLTFLLAFASLASATFTTSNFHKDDSGLGNGGHPALNATKSIDYEAILRKFIGDKGHGENNRCPKVWPRAEWRTLTKEQQESWIKATWCLSARPSMLVGTETHLDGRRTSLLDDFVAIHVRLFYTTHYQASFLPWHRLYVHARDLAMRRECGFTGPFPYWDWSLDADVGQVQHSPVLSNAHGISGNGSSPDGTVTSGPFAYLPLSYRNGDEKNESRLDLEPHYLTRAFRVNEIANPQFPTFHEADSSAAIHRLLMTGTSPVNFTTFATALEGVRKDFEVVNPGLHGGVHRAIGGDMMHSHSPNDPVLFLHHANLDRLWWLWQNGITADRSGATATSVNKTDLSSQFWAYSGNTVEYDVDPTGGPRASLFDIQTLEGLYVPNVETYKLMDIERPPLCYTYV
ncbi:hypothetical protein OC835_004875 [Tilletia horrida]|nr:hypothetical protein OC835_004875 [Tilletia horrida]